jgi:putative hydrolases of HD superfamily
MVCRKVSSSLSVPVVNGLEEKHRREVEAMEYLTSLLPGSFSTNAQILRELFDEYEEGTSPEAILVKDVDKYELLVQSLEYERDAVDRGESLEGLKDLSTFFGVRNYLKTDLVKEWAVEVMKEREQLWERVSNSSTANGV